MDNCLPFTDDVMVVLVHKSVQQTHLLAFVLLFLHLGKNNNGKQPKLLIRSHKWKYVRGPVPWCTCGCLLHLQVVWLHNLNQSD